MSAARRRRVSLHNWTDLVSDPALNGTFTLVPNNDTIFKKKAVTKHYDHSNPINLKKKQIFWISKITTEYVFDNEIETVDIFTVTFKTDGYLKRIRKMSIEEFKTEFVKYDSTSKDYKQKLEELQQINVGIMTANEF